MVFTNVQFSGGDIFPRAHRPGKCAQLQLDQGGLHDAGVRVQEETEGKLDQFLNLVGQLISSCFCSLLLKGVNNYVEWISNHVCHSVGVSLLFLWDFPYLVSTVPFQFQMPQNATC